MSKAYSNKALPSGTILREWRLENVLGVGGFGIVYKGRGIYFDELVAIKEYFPSSISERDEDDTVVPIDSDAEEVHALGLKKFVEEAKLLWNLSTPTRHPNIVSVRSLFEIHGTAYMVMDFEDGVSLSALLKKGTRWNEASLTAMFRPIAEGLERAHRVGVLHRDIKPPNILINEDGRPVLIDFGSARFESGDATSTKVTFHTPPYAAIEQYVRTFDQGPWTDVYALGVVLYECITGTKPAEVLERMHGGAGTALADGEWPGYSVKFLKTVDAAMGIKPTDRPQSISEWLALFDGPDEPLPVADDGDDDDATRVVAFAHSPEIQPVAPPPPGFTRGERVDVPVPDDTSEVRFKRAGEDTNASRKKQALEDLVPAPIAEAEPEAAPQPPAIPEKKKPSAKGAVPNAGEQAAAKKKLSPVLLGGIAAAAIAIAAGGWYFVQQQSGAEPDPTLAEIEAELVPVDIEEAGGVAPAVEALVVDARKANAPAAAVTRLAAAAQQLAGMGETEQNAAAIKAAADFAAALIADADARSSRMSRDLP